MMHLDYAYDRRGIQMEEEPPQWLQQQQKYQYQQYYQCQQDQCQQGGGDRAGPSHRR
jgi:hypothetical protein